MQTAKEIFDIIADAMKTRNIPFEKFEDSLAIKGFANAEIPIVYYVLVREGDQVVTFLSTLPFKMPEERRKDGAVAVCKASYRLCDGSFDYNFDDGTIEFRASADYRNATITGEQMIHMINMALGAVQYYSGNLFLLAKNAITIEQFLERTKK